MKNIRELIVQDDRLYYDYLTRGYTELYYDADYNWFVCNAKELDLVSFAEGDLLTTKCDSQEEYKIELDKMIEWLKKQFYLDDDWFDLIEEDIILK